MLLSFESALVGKRVLVTGHTGFTGPWACLWLRAIGAEVAGLALPPETDPSLYAAAQLDRELTSFDVDVTDRAAVARVVDEWRPEVVVHLAAQTLVRRSYREPLTTFATNTMGTAHVLDAARRSEHVHAVLCITTDKVYQNNEWEWPYREVDPLGGKDPYSASKAAAEMIIGSYSSEGMARPGAPLWIATARGGNIVGGGDWAEDRLVPDFVRAAVAGQHLTLRYPEATRPWQHVLALVEGYLRLASGLLTDPEKHARAWNFGPQESRQYSVRTVVDLMAKEWVQADVEFMDNPVAEAQALAIDSSLARNRLGWSPPWDTPTVIAKTAQWYKAFYAGGTARELCLDQIEEWRNAVAETEQ